MIVAKQNGEATLTNPTLEQTLLSRTELNANLHASRIQSTQVLFPSARSFSTVSRLNLTHPPLHVPIELPLNTPPPSFKVIGPSQNLWFFHC